MLLALRSIYHPNLTIHLIPIVEKLIFLFGSCISDCISLSEVTVLWIIEMTLKKIPDILYKGKCKKDIK